MAIGKESPVTVLDALASLNYNTASSLVPANGVETSSTIQMAIELICTYGSAQTVGARVDVYGSMDDSNYSTQPYRSYDFTMPATSASIRQITDIASAPRYLKFKVLNLDTVTSNANFSNISLNIQRQTI